MNELIDEIMDAFKINQSLNAQINNILEKNASSEIFYIPEKTETDKIYNFINNNKIIKFINKHKQEKNLEEILNNLRKGNLESGIFYAEGNKTYRYQI